MSYTIVAAVLVFLLAVPPAGAISLGEMARQATNDLEAVPGFIAITFYVVGAAVVGLGLLKLKRHVDHPQQTAIGSGMMALLVGVALILTPAVINGLAATLGLDSAPASVVRPRL